MKKTTVLIVVAAAIINLFAQQDETRLLRFPTIFGSRVVFSYAGDLYTADTSGGTARKLTSDIWY